MRIVRICNIQRIIYSFKRQLLQDKMILMKVFLTVVLHNCYEPVYVNLNEGINVWECIAVSNDTGQFISCFSHNIFCKTCIT